MVRKQALVRTALGIALAIGIASASRAEDAAPVRIGVLTDMSGMYRDIMGPGSLLAAQMAVKDFGGKASSILAVGPTSSQTFYALGGTKTCSPNPPNQCKGGSNNLNVVYSPGNAWKSGLAQANGTHKPSYTAFSALAQLIDPAA